MDQQQENMWVQTGAQLAAARIMLKVLKAAEVIMPSYMRGSLLTDISEAIKQAEATGLTTGEE